MTEKELDAEDIERKVHDLAAAMKEVKTAQADRDDVVVEMKHAKISRLELLAEDLAPVFADIPADNEMFDFALARGETPRLWVDMTSFVRMGRDGRRFEFVKDTSLGRTILGSTKNREKIGAQVTKYVAERLLERERLLEGDRQAIETTASALDEAGSEGEATVEAGVTAAKRGGGLMAALGWFVFGLLIGLCALAAAVVFDQLEPIVAWISGLVL